MDKQKINWFGIFLIFLAFLLNPYLVGLALSTDGHIENSVTITLIIVFETFLCVVGIAIYYREKYTFLNLVNNGTLLIISLLFCFVALEGAISFLGEYDADGQFSFAGRALLPYTLPVHALEEEIAIFENGTNPYIIPDPYLGWIMGNNASSHPPQGYYQANSIGVRSEREFNKTKADSVTRIEMFGDSFVYSYEVPMNETLAFYLEQKLSLKEPTEVMNFGVGAYGNDQAYLRWKLLGKEYKPDIVLIGFQAENCKRNVNIVKKFYFRNTKIPFSKPRFSIDNNSLILVNYPTIPYKEVPELVRNFEQNPLSQYEYYYQAEKYSGTNLLLQLKSVRYIFTILMEYREKKNDKMNYKEGEIRDVCYSILKKFYDEASLNATVYIVHLPTQQDLTLKMEGENFVYESLLDSLKKDFKIIDPTEDLIHHAEETTIESLFVGHYSGKANEIVAQSIVKALEHTTAVEHGEKIPVSPQG